ncbi:MAG: class I SAM-dependent methyltransferase [Azoarcus sp.]|nr:class I SAM-dependent methyltransferase [Azoarcus sp.]
MTEKLPEWNAAKVFYDTAYSSEGISAQRRYPNEELCRFIGRHFHHLSHDEKRGIRILETGCGSGANLWMLAREGMETHGLDLSGASLRLAKEMLASHGVSARLQEGDMTRLDYPNDFFDAVVDVFSSYCLTQNHGEQYIREVWRVLRHGGLFFSYFPDKSSDAFNNHAPSTMLDEDTLNGVHRKNSPYYGNAYPFRFMTQQEYSDLLMSHGFEVPYCETVSRSYRRGKEIFAFVTIEGKKQ